MRGEAVLCSGAALGAREPPGLYGVAEPPGRGAATPRWRNPQSPAARIGRRTDDAVMWTRDPSVQENVVSGERNRLEHWYRAGAPVRGRHATRVPVQAPRRRSGPEGGAQGPAALGARPDGLALVRHRH